MKTRILKILLFHISMFFSLAAFTQNNTIDSLQKVLQTQEEDTNKVNTLCDISRFYFSKKEYKTVLLYANKILNMSKKIDYKNGQLYAYYWFIHAYQEQHDYLNEIKFLYLLLNSTNEIKDSCSTAFIYFQLGGGYYYLKNFNKSLENYNSALNIYKKCDDTVNSVLGYVYDRIAAIYLRKGNYSEVLKNYYIALKAFTERNDKWATGLTFQNIGGIYLTEKNSKKALENFFSSLAIRKQLKDSLGIAQTLNCIGDVYYEDSLYSEAFKNYQTALNISEQISQPNFAKAMALVRLAKIYQKDLASFEKIKNNLLRKYYLEKQLDNHLEAKRIWEELSDDRGISEAYIECGKIYFELRKLKEADRYLLEGLKIAYKISYPTAIRDGYYALSELNSYQGNFKEAFNDYRMFIKYKDSLSNEEATKKSLQISFQYDYDKKEALAEVEQSKKEDQIKFLTTQNQLQAVLASKQIQQKKFAYAGSAVIVLIGVYGFYRYRRRRQLQSKQEMLNERLRISRELHDEVGATLSGIAMYSHLTKEQIKNAHTSEVEKSLNIMQQSSGEMVNKLNDIVWLDKP